MTTTARPLTDEDVDKEKRLINNLDSKKFNTIVSNFCNELKRIMSYSIQKTEDETDQCELLRLRRLMTICPDIELFIRTKDKIWDAREKILHKDADYFLKRDYSTLIKKDKKAKFIYGLIEIIRDRYYEASEEMMEFYWKCAQKLLRAVIEYKLLVKQYKQS